MKLEFVVFVIVIILASCHSNNDKRRIYYDEKGYLVERDFFSDSSISGESFYSNDTLLVLYKSYHPNGKLSLIRGFLNNKRQGREFAYHENGKIKYSAKYEAGIKDSICYWYYESGKIKSIENWRDNVPFGSQFVYYESGKVKEYFFNNLEGKTIYERNYDETGNYNQKGQLLYVIEKAARVSIIDSVQLFVFPVSPDNSKVKLTIEEFDTHKNLIKSSTVTDSDLDLKYDANSYYYTTSFSRAGSYTIKTKVRLEDKANGKEYLDSVELSFLIYR